MYKRGKYRLLGIALLLLAVNYAFPQALIKVTANKDSILIGEPVTLQVEIRLPLGAKPGFTMPDTLPHFQILSVGDPVYEDAIDGKSLLQQIKITSFDTGNWQIPPFEARVNGKKISAEPINLSVQYLPFNSQLPYHDIKEIEPVKKPAGHNLLWISLAITLLLLAGMAAYLYLRKKAKPAMVESAPPVSAYEEAMRALKKLKEAGSHTEIDSKAYYTQLNNIFRRFLQFGFGMHSMEQTNAETILQLRKFNMESKYYRELKDLLETADLVKFARYQPAEEVKVLHYNAIREAIQYLNKLS